MLVIIPYKMIENENTSDDLYNLQCLIVSGAM